MTATEQMTQTDDLSARAQWVYARMGEEYGIKPWEHRRTPLHELISTILSHRTNGANEEQAFSQLWGRYASWERSPPHRSRASLKRLCPRTGRR